MVGIISLFIHFGMRISVNNGFLGDGNQFVRIDEKWLFHSFNFAD